MIVSFRMGLDGIKTRRYKQTLVLSMALLTSCDKSKRGRKDNNFGNLPYSSSQAIFIVTGNGQSDPQSSRM